MNLFERRVKKFWHNEQRKLSRDPFDEINEQLLSHTSQSKSQYRSLIRWYYWIFTHKLLFSFITLFCLPLLIYVFLLIFANNRAFIPMELNQHRHNLLLVVAHPDDECLFFSPTLRVLFTQCHFTLNLIVFSRGNHVGLGETRARELHGSCQMLNIAQDRCISLDLPQIQDNPKVWWSERELLPIIDKYVKKWSIDFLVSFDNGGISGHLNHRAVGSAVRLYTRNQTNTMIKSSYELKSVSLLRKYSSILDFYWIFISTLPRLLHAFFVVLDPFNLFPSIDQSYVLLISTPNDYMASRTAFASHQSQYGWDRHLYLLASRYMFVNELKSIDKYGK